MWWNNLLLLQAYLLGGFTYICVMSDIVIEPGNVCDKPEVCVVINVQDNNHVLYNGAQ